MKWLNIPVVRLRGLIWREAVFRDVDEELRVHIDMETEANVRRGMSEADARRAALRSFGNIGLIKDIARDIRGGGVFDHIWQDVRFGARMLLRKPGFTVAATVTLALGIGANSAVFSVIHTVLLRPLPFHDAERLVVMWGRSTRDSTATRNTLSFPDYLDFRDQSQSFAGLAAYGRTSSVLSPGDYTEMLRGVAMTPEVFDVLGISPFLGRGYTREEDKVGAPPVVILTQPLWQRAFGADPKILGQQITLSGRICTVIGVMPAGWKFPVQDERVDYVIPFKALIGRNELPGREAHFIEVVGRLKPGVQLRQAEAELSGIAARLAKQYPDTNTNFQAVTVVPLHADLVGDVRPALLILLGAVMLVLLIACANVANLLLARAAGRSREFAIRSALGASRIGLMRQLLCESLLLALLGGAVGLFFAWWWVGVLRAFGPRDIPRLSEIAVNGTVAGFTFLIAVVSTLVFGLVPALQVSRASVNAALQQGAKGSTGGIRSNGVRAVLVVSQVAVSLLLLAGAGLMMKSFFNLRGMHPGFDRERVMTMSVALPKVRYPEGGQQVRTFDRVLEQLRGVPGIQSVGAVYPLPLTGEVRTSSFAVSGTAPIPVAEHLTAGHLIVAPGYFETMNIPVHRGRMIDQRDTKDAPLVVMINEALATRYFPDRDPLTQQVMIDRGDHAPPCQVIGVVANTRHEALAVEPGPEFYVPLAQDPDRRLDIVVKTSVADFLGVDNAVRRAIHEIDRELVTPKLRPMQELLSLNIAQPRFNMMLLAVFAGVAVVLAAVGIYGVIAYSVAQRTREIGIRMALGAQRTQMLGMVLRQSLTLVALGLAIGLIASLAGTRLLTSLLYGVATSDVPTYVVVMTLLGGAALLASYIPARRAMKVDPMIALRYE